MSEVKETFTLTLVCGFCGQQKETTLPVKLDRPFKLTRGCERCMIKGRKGERVRLCSRYLQGQGFGKFADAPTPNEVFTIKSARQWQHGMQISITEHPARSYDSMDFTPEKYQPSDFQVVREKLLAKEAKLEGVIGLFKGALWTAWQLNGRGIVLATDGNSIGLYDFIGEPGAPVEADLAYLEGR